MRAPPPSWPIAALSLWVAACGNRAQTVSSSQAVSATVSAQASSSASPAPSASVVILGTSPEIDSACRDYADTVCHREESCGPAILAWRHADLASCDRIETRVCEVDLAPPSSGATAETIRACAAARAASCESLLQDPPPDCLKPGTTQDGAPCAQNTQCAGGFCDRDADRHCGTCRHLAELQQPCTRGSVCNWGLVCMSGQCQKRESAPVVAPSKIAKLGEHCAKDVACVGGGYCGPKKICVKNARDGDPCGPSGPFCESPSLCVTGICTLLDPSTCR